jgi:MoxR-like ATPase
MATNAIQAAVEAASEGLVDREAVVQLIALGVVAREHVLLIGPPGTAKSEAVRRIARTLGASLFEYLLGRFTEPSELFGPVDLARLADGVVETRTEGMLPEAEFAFLDEVFLGSTAILNTLLGLLNERRFRRGQTDIAVPLRICVGASNHLPEDPSLAAFGDRFLLRTFLRPIPETELERLLEAGAQRPELAVAAGVEDLDALAEQARAVDLSGIRTALADAIRKLRGSGVALSDRRIVKSQKVIAAAAALDGRRVATVEDLWPLVFVVPTEDGQDVARDVLRETLESSRNRMLGAAAEEASLGPAARADRLVTEGERLLALPDDPAVRLRLEAVIREVDAGFLPDALPPTLAGVRERIAAVLRP